MKANREITICELSRCRCRCRCRYVFYPTTNESNRFQIRLLYLIATVTQTNHLQIKIAVCINNPTNRPIFSKKKFSQLWRKKIKWLKFFDIPKYSWQHQEVWLWANMKFCYTWNCCYSTREKILIFVWIVQTNESTFILFYSNGLLRPKITLIFTYCNVNNKWMETIKRFIFSLIMALA